MKQAALPIQGAARCGYCGERLTLQAGGDWKCEPCKPGLAKVQNAEDWAAFHKARAKGRQWP